MGIRRQKRKNCDPENPDDDKQGDHWDHVALDPEHRLVVSVVPGEAFGTPGYVRISYATSMDRIDEGLRRLTQFFSAAAAA